MFIIFEHRVSDSPIVDRVWRSHSEAAGDFLSMASCNWSMVVTRHEGNTFLTVRGPETIATVAECPADGDWIGIQFKLGTFMPSLPIHRLLNRSDVNLPGLSSRSFYLNGSKWEYPSFDNAETFVQRLLKKGLIANDPCVTSALHDRRGRPSQRTAQRHFLRATGITKSTIRQIERARQATYMLQRGASASQVIVDLGYYDQAHLIRSLKHYIGQTPTQISRGEEQLSLLYNTAKP